MSWSEPREWNAMLSHGHNGLSVSGFGHEAQRVTVVPGDGIGPEITGSVLTILAGARAGLDAEFAEAGEAVYLEGNTSGIPAETWNSIRRTGVVLKGPITTPQGGGYKSLNVTMRKTLGLYANVRPCRSYMPYVRSAHPLMDTVIVRENEEDLYAGIEHRQTADVTQCLKLITRRGSERIVRYAFEYARQRGRRKVTCLTKDNIMKMTDGLFHRVFDEVRAEYGELQAEHQIVDFGMANFVHRPEEYDVVVLPNLYGDILSDIAAQMTGSVGMGGSVNIGTECAVFEAIHGSAPGLARDVANPSGLLLAALEMLSYVGKAETATLIHDAWLTTLEDGIHTVDIANETTVERVGTKRFTEAVLERIGEKPNALGRRAFAGCVAAPALPEVNQSEETLARRLEGVDVFLRWSGGQPDDLAGSLAAIDSGRLKLQVVTNRGVKVWPNGHESTLCTDHWRCRFLPVEKGLAVGQSEVLGLLAAIGAAGLDWIKTENLYTFAGVPGYSLAQGQ